MALRIFIGIILLFIVCVAPWWWSVVLIFIALFVFDGYPEGYILASVLIMRTYPDMVFSERVVWFGGLFVIWGLLAFIAGQLHGARHSDLYA